MIPDPDAVLAGTVQYGDEDRLDPVVLTLTREWPGQGLAPVDAQRDPVTTALTPTVEPVAGHHTWLFSGFGLNPHEDLGAVRITYALLLERSADGRLDGWWYEHRMVVPTSLWRVAGSVAGGQVELVLTEQTEPGVPGVPARVTGLLQPGL